uniref:Uncharacterized protein n=1 Tax=Canis lupus familiaris TaxID=9615 RepID=A0A8I3MD40_CANLF
MAVAVPQRPWTVEQLCSERLPKKDIINGLAPAFGPGRDPGVPGSSPTSGSRHGAYFSLLLCLCLSLSVYDK